jgi:hypothetical protein
MLPISRDANSTQIEFSVKRFLSEQQDLPDGRTPLSQKFNFGVRIYWKPEVFIPEFRNCIAAKERKERIERSGGVISAGKF